MGFPNTYFNTFTQRYGDDEAFFFNTLLFWLWKLIFIIKDIPVKETIKENLLVNNKYFSGIAMNILNAFVG